MFYAQGGPTRVQSSDIATPGMFTTKTLTKECINLADEAAQVIRLQLTAATPSVLYSVTINGFAVEFTTPSTIAMPDLQALLIEKLSLAPEVSGQFAIAKLGADSVSLTAKLSGVAYPFAGSALIAATQTTAPASAKDLSCGIIVTARKSFVEGLQVCGASTSATQKPIGATQYGHALVQADGNYLNAFGRGDAVSVVAQGQGWMQFESQADLSVDGNLYYRAVPSAANPITGRLLYSATAPAGCVAISATLDSETSTIADGRIVGLVTLSLV